MMVIKDREEFGRGRKNSYILIKKSWKFQFMNKVNCIFHFNSTKEFFLILQLDFWLYKLEQLSAHPFWLLFCLFLQWPTITYKHSYGNTTTITTDYHTERIPKLHTLHLLATKRIENCEFSQQKQKSTSGAISNKDASA